MTSLRFEDTGRAKSPGTLESLCGPRFAEARILRKLRAYRSDITQYTAKKVRQHAIMF